MSAMHPLTEVIRHVIPASAQAANTDIILGIAPFAGTVTSVKYIPDTDITGANTNTRKVSVINRGSAGSGTTEMAALSFTSGINGTAFAAKTITLSGTAANLAFVAGDVLAFKSEAVASGLADPGGTVEVTISRS
jgi:hypothetical protein